MNNDEPTIDEDLFGQEEAAMRLARQLASVNPPAVLGLHGDWGSGKTSFLNRVHRTLTNQNRLKPDHYHKKQVPEFDHCVVVWFEAWRYQHDETPVVALLNEIRSQFKWQAALIKKFEYAAAITFEAGLRSLDALTGEIAQIAAVGKAGLVSSFRDAATDWKKENLAFALPSQATRDLLNNAIKATIKPLTERNKSLINRLGQPPDPRVIIIVDDLDRCQPFTAYKLLEGIKIFLGIPSCVFLLGINREEIVRSVAIGMRRDEGLEVHGSIDAEKKVILRAHEYLEKLCGHISYLPFPTRAQMVTYVTHLLRERRGQTREKMPPDRQYIIALLEDSPISLLPANPRRVKTFVNLLLDLLAKHPLPPAPPGGDAFTPEQMALRAGLFILIASIATFHPAIYRALVADPTFLTVLQKWCRAEATLTQSERMLVASARLPGTDTDDYKILEDQFIDRDEHGRTVVLAEMPQMHADPASPEIFRMRRLLLKPAFQELKPEDIAPFLLHCS